MYTVYQHRNLKNGKYYIGSTSMNPKERWNNGRGYKNQPKMWADIQNSDWNSDWQHEILGKFENKKDALNYEAFLIAMLDSIENGYNTSSYSRGTYKRSDEHRKKISESMIGIIFTDEHRKHISESKPKKPVLQYSKTGEFIAEYPSTREAEIQTGCNRGNICLCCKGEHKSCGGFIWRYK